MTPSSAVEMMVVKMEQGWDPRPRAASLWPGKSTAFPMLTGTLVTAAGFLPIGFCQHSAVGEYAGRPFSGSSRSALVASLVRGR